MCGQKYKKSYENSQMSVASLGGSGGTAPGDTLQGGDTRRKNFCGQIYKE